MEYNTVKNVAATPVALFSNLFLSMVVLMAGRIIFFLVNQSYFPGINGREWMDIIRGGLIFDLSALFYINSLYIVLMTVPTPLKENKIYQRIAKGLFLATNSIALIMNLMDAVYFQFTNRRTTASVFSEFSGEHNLGSIIATELLNHWYLTLAAVVLIAGMAKCYRTPRPMQQPLHRISYSIGHAFLFLAIIPCAIFGIRGGIGHAVRPITISNANQYVNKPVEAAIVLNTPFSVIRTIGKKVYKDPAYFQDKQEMANLFTPVRDSRNDSTAFTPLNVVVLIMESFGKEYIGYYNRHLEGGTYKGYTPFLDSLITQSLTFEYSFANGRKSIDAMPSVLSSIPMFIEPYFVTHYSMNKVSGIAGELKKKGYHTSFFHGAPNGSMGFEAFSRTSGFDDYFGLNEYGNKKDFDGMWAIWDEEFFQFFADKLGTFPQPFVSAIFSASSHHPFKIPQKYQEIYPEGTLPIHKCIRYTDHALNAFFEKAARQPWFKNTLFVITADHTNAVYYPEYKTDWGRYAVPIIFYHPGSELKGYSTLIAQQIDIMPTVLGYLGYDHPYVAFGKDLLHTDKENEYAVNYNNQVYQFFKGNYMLQFDGKKTIAVYDFVHDKMLKENLLGQISVQTEMEAQLKAIIQQYIQRMASDQLTVK